MIKPYFLLLITKKYSLSFFFIAQHIVVHQGDARVLLTPPFATIYCIASSHSHTFEYDWMFEEEPTGVSSPVIYVSRTGLYKCEVTSDTGSICTSNNIEVFSGLFMVL